MGTTKTVITIFVHIVVFEDGVTEKDYEIDIINDDKYEFVEKFSISLGCDSNEHGCDLNGAVIDNRPFSNTTLNVEIVDDNDISPPSAKHAPHVVRKTGGSITVGWHEPTNKGGRMK